jgi:hypothetical protein
MDSGLAVIIGAAIALVSSSVIPWIRESVTKRAQSELEYRAALRDAMRASMRALSEMSHSRKEGMTREEMVSHRERLLELALVVRGDDRPVSLLVDRVASDFVEDDDTVGIASYRALVDVVPRWFRGEIDSSNLVNRFDAEVVQWRHHFAMEEVRSQLNDEERED